jgi:NAD(P)-dependent dehydrogenase (short-subunit alcohol dehydrogenase family)
MDIPYADAKHQIDVNFWGVYHGCRSFLPHLLERPEARIINISSLFGLIGVPSNSLYCASKFAVRGLTESLMSELADTSVRFTSVHPGAVATDIARDASLHGDALSRRRSEKVISNGITPERAADIIVDGVRAGREKVLVGPDAHVMDRMARLAPTGHRYLVRHLATRLGRKKGRK